MRLSNEIEFLKMKGYSVTPKIVQMEVTRECPLSCPQCYKDLSGKKHMDIEILLVGNHPYLDFQNKPPIRAAHFISSF